MMGALYALMGYAWTTVSPGRDAITKDLAWSTLRGYLVGKAQ